VAFVSSAMKEANQKSSLASTQSEDPGQMEAAVAFVSLKVEEPPFKTDWKSFPAKSLIQRGFLGLRTASPSSSSTLAVEEDSSTSYQVMGSPIAKSLANVSMVALPKLSSGSSLGAAELGMRFCLSHPGMMESGTPIYFSVSKSRLGYSRRVKKNISKQLNKNKKMLAKVVADPPVVGLEGYSEGVLDTMGCAPTLGLTFGGDEKKLFNLFSVIEEDHYCVEGVSISNSKGKRKKSILLFSLGLRGGWPLE
jgi:hypothetical protein